MTYSDCKVAKLLILHTAKSISDRLLDTSIALNVPE